MNDKHTDEEAPNSGAAERAEAPAIAGVPTTARTKTLRSASVPPVVWVPLFVGFWAVCAWSNIHSLVMYGTAIIEWSSQSLVRRVLATGAAIAVGAFLYAMRSRNRGMYGMFEIVFSLALLWGALGTVTADAGVRLLAGVYVLVRGLESFSIAFATPKQ